MKPYKAEVEVTNKYSIEVHAGDETEATQHVENMEAGQIEDGGDFIETVGVEVTEIEPMEPDDEEDEVTYTEDDGEAIDTDLVALEGGTDNGVIEPEVEPEPGDTITEQEVEPEDV